MYADSITPNMREAIDETNRRREKQIAYNTEHGIDPQPLRKKISDVTDMLAREDIDTEALLEVDTAKETSVADRLAQDGTEIRQLLEDLTEQMHAAAEQLQFELAARLRDEILDVKKELRQIENA